MVHLHAHRGGVFFFQSGSCSPRAQLMRPPNSLDGSLGTLSMASNTSFRSAFGSVILPDFVGTPLMGASRLHSKLSRKWSGATHLHAQAFTKSCAGVRRQYRLLHRCSHGSRQA